MKRIFYPLSLAAVLLLASCAGEKGTSTEVADANNDENVDPNHLNNYYRPGTAATTNIAVTTDPSAATQQDQSAVQLVTDYYTDNNPVEYYNFNATARMGGLATESNLATSVDKGTGSNAGNNQQNTNNTNISMPQTTTANTQTSQATDSDKAEKQKADKATNKKTEKKKERLTPYNDKQ